MSEVEVSSTTDTVAQASPTTIFSSARCSKYCVRLRLSVLLRHCYFFSLLTEQDLAALPGGCLNYSSLLSINIVLVEMR